MADWYYWFEWNCTKPLSSFSPFNGPFFSMNCVIYPSSVAQIWHFHLKILLMLSMGGVKSNYLTNANCPVIVSLTCVLWMKRSITWANQESLSYSSISTTLKWLAFGGSYILSAETISMHSKTKSSCQCI